MQAFAWNCMNEALDATPVRAVSIPKKSGDGERILGVPTRASYCTLHS